MSQTGCPFFDAVFCRYIKNPLKQNLRGQKRLYFPAVSAQTMAMTNTDQSSAGKPSIFVTRRWPADAEAALSQYFIPTFNLDDRPLSAAEMAVGFASHDAIAPTVSDKIGADVITAGANGKGG